MAAPIIAAMTNSNGGLYTALAGEYGDSSDVGALAVLAINDGPFLTMVAFGATGLADIPLIDLVACVVPLVIGFILGNLDEDLRHFLGSQMNLLIPFFAFPLGASLNFRTIINAGAPGLILGVVVTIITGSALRDLPLFSDPGNEVPFVHPGNDAEMLAAMDHYQQ